MIDLDDDDPAPGETEEPSQLGRDLDRLGIFIKRAATIGAALGFFHHLHCALLP